MKRTLLAFLMIVIVSDVAQAGLRGGPDGTHAGTPVTNVPWEGVHGLLPALALGHAILARRSFLRKRR
jgi:hypothetical protein